ncbi:alcohol dehydrogenase-like [Phlebotomus argentipes]|uniref:alcohol dehydrogenase-like n=1 Tax=Phlebotomus argentipes TaxID=94469 RepID=UPI0028932AC5|nr:alcohol dehydrogenase-like [Phlebotomus argentipes]
MSLAAKSALITGGTGGIGSAIVEELLENGIQSIAVLDLSSQEPFVVQEWRKRFPAIAVKYYRVDVSSQEELEKCYGEFVKETKGLDIVVNCAATFNENMPKRVVDVNLNGVIQSTIIAIEKMRADGSGVIVNVSSDTGLAPFSLGPTYSVTKHAVIAFTRALAHKRDFLGIKFLSLCPGPTDTEMAHNCFQFTFMPNKEQIDAIRSQIFFQSCEVVGKATVKYIQKGKTRSVWLVSNNKIEEIPVEDVKF